jgi:hypothetical protein
MTDRRLFEPFTGTPSSYGNGFHGGEKVTKLNCHVVGETQSLIAASSTKKIAHGHFFNYSLAT